jgi:hypothetical protein
MKDNKRRTSKSTRYLLSATESVSKDDLNDFAGREALLRTESPNIGDGHSDDDEETLYTDKSSVQ